MKLSLSLSLSRLFMCFIQGMKKSLERERESIAFINKVVKLFRPLDVTHKHLSL